MRTDIDYYELLKVNRNATEDEIRAAYRSLVRTLHPDTSGADTAEEFQQVQEAYEILSDPDQRRRYNRLREAQGLDRSSALSLWTTISHQEMLVNVEQQALYALIEISPAADLPTSRLPLNLCLVLDRSTSMQGVRLQQVKEGTRQIIEQLNDQDALSIVVFSDRAEVILPSQQGVDRAMAKSIASTIQASGGTEMFQGLQAGLKELERHRTDNSVNHLILLTDGRTYGDEQDCLEKAQWAGQNQISLTTMGIGSDWNEVLLDKMATASGESSVYIDSPGKVITAFKEKIRALSSVVARDMSLTVNAANQVEVREVVQVTPHIRRLDHRGGKAVLGPLGTTEGKTILVELRVMAFEQEGRQRLARLTIEGDVPGQADRRNWEWADVHTNFVSEMDDPAPIPPTLVTALGKLAIYKMQEKAMEDLSEGRISTATQRLETMATRLLNLGETELARAALLEAGRLARTGDLSDEGRKKIHYGTRALSMLPKEVNHD